MNTGKFGQVCQLAAMFYEGDLRKSKVSGELTHFYSCVWVVCVCVWCVLVSLSMCPFILRGLLTAVVARFYVFGGPSIVSRCARIMLCLACNMLAQLVCVLHFCLSVSFCFFSLFMLSVE